MMMLRPEAIWCSSTCSCDREEPVQLMLSSRDYSNDREILDWLLDHGVDIDKTDTGRLANGFHGYRRENFDWSNHLLNNVAAAGDIELFDHLVSRGADPHRSLALHEVSRCRDEEKAAAMVDHLVEKYGMDIHADNESLRDYFHASSDSGTPLVAAVDAGNLAVVEALLRKGASSNACGPSLRDPWGRAIGNCMWEGFMPALRPLLNAGADANEVLKHAVSEHKYEAVQLALEYGADPEMGLAEFRQRDAERLEANSNTTEGFVDFNGSEDDEERIEKRAAVLKLLTSRCRNFKPVGSRAAFE